MGSRARLVELIVSELLRVPIRNQVSSLLDYVMMEKKTGLFQLIDNIPQPELRPKEAHVLTPSPPHAHYRTLRAQTG